MIVVSSFGLVHISRAVFVSSVAQKRVFGSQII